MSRLLELQLLPTGWSIETARGDRLTRAELMPTMPGCVCLSTEIERFGSCVCAAARAVEGSEDDE